MRHYGMAWYRVTRLLARWSHELTGVGSINDHHDINTNYRAYSVFLKLLVVVTLSCRIPEVWFSTTISLQEVINLQEVMIAGKYWTREAFCVTRPIPAAVCLTQVGITDLSLITPAVYVRHSKLKLHTSNVAVRLFCCDVLCCARRALQRARSCGACRWHRSTASRLSPRSLTSRTWGRAQGRLSLPHCSSRSS